MEETLTVYHPKTGQYQYIRGKGYKDLEHAIDGGWIEVKPGEDPGKFDESESKENAEVFSSVIKELTKKPVDPTPKPKKTRKKNK